MATELGKGQGGRAVYGTPVIPAAGLGAKLLGIFLHFIPAILPVLIPIVTEQPSTAALGDIPGPQAGTEAPEAVPWHVLYPNTLVRYTSPGMTFLHFRASQVFTISLQSWKSIQAAGQGNGTAEQAWGWPGAGRSLPRVRDGWWQMLVPGAHSQVIARWDSQGGGGQPGTCSGNARCCHVCDEHEPWLLRH